MEKIDDILKVDEGNQLEMFVNKMSKIGITVHSVDGVHIEEILKKEKDGNNERHQT